MRRLHRLHAGDEALVCAAYAEAEVKGQAFRKRGDFRMSPEAYARALWRDGIVKGWLP